MKLKDELVELIDTKYSEMQELLQDVDCISASPEMVKKLYDTIPLIEDIKTEISDISRQVHKLKPKKEEEPTEDGDDLGPSKGNDQPVDPPNSPEEQKLLDDLDKMLKDWDKFQKKYKRYKLPNNTNVPDFGDWMRNFAASWYLWKEIVEKKLLETMRLDPQVQQSQLIVRESNSILEKLSSMDGFISGYLVDIKDVVDNILDKITRCCDAMLQYLVDLSHDASVIEHKLDVLNPEGQQTQNLGVEGRLRSVQSDIGVIRGLLRQPIFITIWSPDGDDYKPTVIKNGPVKRRDPKTKTDEGAGVMLTDPDFQCLVYEYKQVNYYEEEVSKSEAKAKYSLNIFKLQQHRNDYMEFQGYFYTVEIWTHQVTKTWLENSCEPGAAYDVVISDDVIDKRTEEREKKAEIYRDPMAGLNGVGVPSPLPPYIEAWLTSQPGGAISIDTMKKWNAHPNGRADDGPTAGSVDSPDLKTSIESEENHDMVEVRVFGSDYDNDDLARVTAGPGFNYRDRVLKEISVSQTVTREDFKGAVPVNGYIPGDWNSGTVISASFQSSGTAPKDCVTYKVNYGWWLFKIKRQ